MQAAAGKCNRTALWKNPGKSGTAQSGDYKAIKKAFVKLRLRYVSSLRGDMEKDQRWRMTGK